MDDNGESDGILLSGSSLSMTYFLMLPFYYVVLDHLALCLCHDLEHARPSISYVLLNSSCIA